MTTIDKNGDHHSTIGRYEDHVGSRPAGGLGLLERTAPAREAFDADEFLGRFELDSGGQERSLLRYRERLDDGVDIADAEPLDGGAMRATTTTGSKVLIQDRDDIEQDISERIVESDTEAMKVPPALVERWTGVDAVAIRVLHEHMGPAAGPAIATMIHHADAADDIAREMVKDPELLGAWLGQPVDELVDGRDRYIVWPDD